MSDKPSKDNCKECPKRRKDGYMFCTCGNKLWIIEKPITKTCGGNAHQGYH